ncbi:MAG TPA: sigma-70 family RNA polymerase sigma factor [Ilumatobacter sp.]|nr:sigma-70 family RNA polymerase sigma factor [Ilumatobacter sp.]
MRDLSHLASDARDGDRDALARFVTEIQTDVWRFCAHLTRVDDADDLAQEALMRIVANLHRWERGPVATWALGVARNVCYEHLRKRYRRRTDPVAEPTTPAEADHASLVDTIHLLDSLPVEQREAIVLTQLIGLPYAEAAEVAGCPVGTIRSRVARGRDTLAAVLRPGQRRVAD